ncbi:MAG: folate-binding protein, partial [Pontimonas sp.]
MVLARSEHVGSSQAAGDFLKIQRDIAHGHALVAGDQWAVMTVTGPDRLMWLNSLITQDVLSLAPGQTVESLLLNPQGRIEHAFFVSDDGTSTWLLVPSDHIDDFEAWLTSMVFRMDVAIERPVGCEVVLATDQRLLENIGSAVVFADPWPKVSEGSVGYAEGTHPGETWMLYSAVVEKEVLEGISLPIVDSRYLEGLSVAAARPAMSDVDEKALPHELDWLRTAVHLSKGCYRGQETVAKVHNLGPPPRRLTLRHRDGSESVMPTPGDEVRLGA